MSNLSDIARAPSRLFCERPLLAESSRSEIQIIADLNVRFEEKQTSGD
jgi:hypothetical protein